MFLGRGNDTVLIHAGHKVLRTDICKIFYQFHRHIVIFTSGINHKNYPRYFLNVVLFCFSVNIHNQHITKNDILHKIIAVESVFAKLITRFRICKTTALCAQKNLILLSPDRLKYIPFHLLPSLYSNT